MSSTDCMLIETLDIFSQGKSFLWQPWTEDNKALYTCVNKVLCAWCPISSAVPIPVSENASDSAENAGISIGKYPSLAQIRHHVIYYSLNGTQLLFSLLS